MAKGKVHRRGGELEPNRVGRTQEDMKRRRKRPCISAPSVPANVDLQFRKIERNHKKRWNGRVKWDFVTTDVAGRPLPKNTDNQERADGYQIQLQACDPSGDPIELPLQEDSADFRGGQFADVTGTSTVVKDHERRLNATGNIIDSPNLTGLTGGIEVVVQFFAHLVSSGSASVKFEVWNQSSGSSVISKTRSVSDFHHGKLQAKMKFTPSGGTTYRARVTYVSGAQNPVVTKVEYADLGDTALWQKRAADDDDRVLFKELARPKVWYYQARVRARSNHHHRRCWSAWSAWTTPINPVTGDEPGPPPPSGLTLTFDRVEGKKHNPFRAKVQWNEVGWWIPPDGDAEEGAKDYAVKLGVSNDGGSSTVNTRHKRRVARDDDADTTADLSFRNIRRARVYRAAVRARDHAGNWGAWSAWTAWISPTSGIGSGPNTSGMNITKRRPGPRRIEWEWTDPTDHTDVDHYKVEIYGGSPQTLKRTVQKRGRHHRYAVPEEDKGTFHKAIITPVDEEGNLGTSGDSGDEQEGGTVDGDILTPGTLPPTNADLNEGDGSPPSSSPTPIVKGGPTFFFLKWTPISNANQVAYDVYVSATNGFTPGATSDALTPVVQTLAGSTIVKTRTDGSNFSYGVTYYFKIVARDVDGSAAASAQAQGSMVQIQGGLGAGDILADTIIGNDIFANTILSTEIGASAITTSELAANSIISSHINASQIIAIHIHATSALVAKLMTTNEGGQSNFITIDGTGSKDQVQFWSAGSQTVITAVGSGMRFAGGAAGRMAWWGNFPTTRAVVNSGLGTSGTAFDGTVRSVVNNLVSTLKSYGIVG